MYITFTRLIADTITALILLLMLQKAQFTKGRGVLSKEWKYDYWYLPQTELGQSLKTYKLGPLDSETQWQHDVQVWKNDTINCGLLQKYCTFNRLPTGEDRGFSEGGVQTAYVDQGAY